MGKEKKNLKNFLREIYGVGKFLSCRFCRQYGFKEQSRIDCFNIKQKSSVINSIEDNKNFLIGEDNLRFVKDRVTKLLELRCFRGFRHRLGLPTRGQRTHTNRKTARKLNKNRF